MTNIVATVTNKLLLTAAYKYVAMAVMITNCNLFVQKIQLPLEHPICMTNIILSRCSVNPPRLMGFGGSVVTTNYFFGFGHGHLANFWQWQFHPESIKNIRAQQEAWSKMTSQIGTNEVHQLALDWLTALGVDTVKMGQKYSCKMEQKFFYSHADGSLEPADKSKVPLPIYEISWGSIPLRGHPEYSFPAATMTIFGPTKQLMEYHLFDDSLMLTPKLAVRDSEKLLAITDAQFQQFDEMQKSNLVSEFVP